MWKDEIRKNIFDEDSEEMTDFMNVSPRMKQEAEKRKGYRGGPKDVERKVQTLRGIKKDLGEKIGILYSTEFMAGFPKDSADDIMEVVKHLKAAFEILQDFGE